MWLVYFFYATATTAFYTYLHTLSLHDALPIGPDCAAQQGQSKSFISSANRSADAISSSRTQISGSNFCLRARNFSNSSSFSARSEEHTSELQSLMRISSAVFCLKKNTLTNPAT